LKINSCCYHEYTETFYFNMAELTVGFYFRN